MIIQMTPKTRQKTEFCRLLSYRQSFVKSIGVFPGPWSILLKNHPVLKELREIIIWMLALEDCDVVTASGWEWSNPHPANIDNP